MNGRNLTRRLLAGAAGLAIGLGGALALVAPAQATGQHGDGAKVDIVNDCDWMKITIDPKDTRRTWHIMATVGEETWMWPAGDLAPDGTPPDNGWIEGAAHTVLVPAGAKHVTVRWWHGDGDPDLEKLYEWDAVVYKEDWHPPRGVHCDKIQEPTFTQPTCDASGTITIPAAPEDLPKWLKPFIYKVNGEVAERGSTLELGPGTYEVTVWRKKHYEEVLLKTFVVVLEEPDCPTPPPTTPPDDGEGGELPKTGNQAVLFGGGALLLLSVGGGLYAVARRRRITFSA